ncbi:MAG: hypothetical protein KAR00_01530 [Candidatus Pacebacteria bacterium]|nr:hypothetical protein [Candidatus Paceibacterota bacterium]
MVTRNVFETSKNSRSTVSTVQSRKEKKKEKKLKVNTKIEKSIQNSKEWVKRQRAILTRNEIILVSVLAILIALLSVSIFFSLKQFDRRIIFLCFFLFVLYKMITIRWAHQFYFKNDKSAEP